MCNKDKMRELISTYLDTEATEQERLQVEQHLRVCADCAKYYRELKNLRGVMGKLGADELSPDSQQKIRNDFLGGKLKREAVMKRKILVSAGSVALTLLLVFAFVIPGHMVMKRGVQGRLKDASDRISGGEAFSSYEAQSLSTTVSEDRINTYSGDKVLVGATQGLKSVESSTGAFYPYAVNFSINGSNEGLLPQNSQYRKIPMGVGAWGSVSALSQEQEMYAPMVIVEPYIPQSGNGDKVVYGAAASIKVPDAQAAYDHAAKIVHEAKGFMGTTRFSQTEQGRRVVFMSLRVPRDKFEEVLNALRTFGDVKQMVSTNRDVSQRYHEVTQQLTNLKVIYDKLVDQFKDKKTDVQKAETINNQLTPYLRQIEALRGELGMMDNMINMSTIDVTFEESSFKMFLKHKMENIHEQEAERAAAAVKSLALLIPALIAFVIVLLCVLAAWSFLKGKFIKKE
jgi:hypothetical protein